MSFMPSGVVAAASAGEQVQSFTLTAGDIFSFTGWRRSVTGSWTPDVDLFNFGLVDELNTNGSTIFFYWNPANIPNTDVDGFKSIRLTGDFGIGNETVEVFRADVAVYTADFGGRTRWDIPLTKDMISPNVYAIDVTRPA